MKSPRQASFLFLGALILANSKSVSASISNCTDVILESADDAQELGDNCQSIQDELTIGTNFTDSVEIEGLESINGTITIDNCGHLCPRTAHNLTFPSLRSISGDLLVDWGGRGGLQALSFPELKEVSGRISIGGWNLTTIDLDSLEYMGSISLNTPVLETLRIDNLKGFLEGGPHPGVYLDNIGNLDSVDAFFKKDLVVPMGNIANDTMDFSGIEILAGAEGWPNVRNFTFGWSAPITNLVIWGNDMAVVLGGPDTESVYIETLELNGDVVSVERGSDVDNVTIGTYSFFGNGNSTNFPHLDLDFEYVGNVSVQNLPALQSVWMPERVREWDMYELTVYGSDKFDFMEASTWRWPKSIGQLGLDGNMDEDLLSSRKAARPRLETNWSNISEPFFAVANGDSGSSAPSVSDAVYIMDRSGRIDCDEIYDLHEDTDLFSMPTRDFLCGAENENAAALAERSTWFFGLVAAAVLVGMF